MFCQEHNVTLNHRVEKMVADQLDQLHTMDYCIHQVAGIAIECSGHVYSGQSAFDNFNKISGLGFIWHYTSYKNFFIFVE